MLTLVIPNKRLEKVSRRGLLNIEKKVFVIFSPAICRP